MPAGSSKTRSQPLIANLSHRLACMDLRIGNGYTIRTNRLRCNASDDSLRVTDESQDK